jgi:hypothetical protein
VLAAASMLHGDEAASCLAPSVASARRMPSGAGE